MSRKGEEHTIRELEVVTLLTLDNTKVTILESFYILHPAFKDNCGQDYETGDNSDIIATDSQKNTVYVLAKQHGVASPEEFGLLLATHFVSKYPWVTRARVQVTAHPWQRIPDR